MENNNDKSETEGSNPEVQFPTNSPQVVNEQGDHSPFTNQVVDNGAVDNSLEERNTDSLNDSIDSERSGENAYSRNRQRRPRITLHFNDDMATDRTENAIEEIEQPSSDDDEFDMGTDIDMWSVDDSSSDSPERSKTPNTAVAAAHVKSLISKPKPGHTWFILKELRRREIGINQVPQRFTGKYYGSLHAVQRLELMYKLEEHTGCVNAINFNRAGTRLVSASDDRKAVVWDWATGKCQQAFNTGHESNVFQAKFLSLIGEEHIVTCSRDGQNLQNFCRFSKYLSQTFKYVTFSRLMHVKHDEKKIRLYSIHANPMTSNEIVIGGEDAYIRIYDRRNIKRNGLAPIQFKPTLDIKPYSVYVTCAVFNYNGTEVLGSYNDDDIYLFDAKAPSNSVKGVNFFGPRSEFVISGSDCGYIYIWDKKTESIVQWMRGDEDGVINCLEPHPWIPVLATSGLDSDIKIWIPSCEQEPKMDGLQETLLKNIRSKETRRHFGPSREPFNEVLILGRWMRHLRYLEQTRRGSSTPDPFAQRDDLFEASSASSSD
uniref:Uncharacterized protein n=1 Tax=Rhodnius prolixus TaxID=13249 RepID=T1HA57_RHOPR